MKKFEIGDKVRVVGGDFDQNWVGKTGRIVRAAVSFDWIVVLKCGDDVAFREKELERL